MPNLDPDSEQEPASVPLDGYELSDKDIANLKKVEQGQSVNQEDAAWLEQSGLISGGKLTPAGSAIVELPEAKPAA